MACKKIIKFTRIDAHGELFLTKKGGAHIKKCKECRETWRRMLLAEPSKSCAPAVLERIRQELKKGEM